MPIPKQYMSGDDEAGSNKVPDYIPLLGHIGTKKKTYEYWCTTCGKSFRTHRLFCDRCVNGRIRTFEK